eukprot:jgi/Psemu1/19658/gm1.19658_g
MTQQKQHRNNSILQRVLHNETPWPVSMFESEDSNRDETNASTLKKKLEDTLWKLDARNRGVDVMKEKMEEMAEQEAAASVIEDDGMTTNSEKRYKSGRRNETVHKDILQVTKPNVPGAQFYAYNNSIVKYRKNSILGDKDFYYFVTPILAGISPSHNKFKQSKEMGLISDIFLVSDEAFGFMILHNKHHVWINNRGRKKDETIRRERKRYCDAKIGSRDGWMLEGVETFNSVCEALIKLRKHAETECDLEVKLRDRFQPENRRNYDITSGTTAF